MTLGPQHFKTYGIRAPIATHFRPATCEEFRCPAYLRGFAIRIDATKDPGIGQAYYIRHDKSRAFTEERDESGLTVFRFPPGMACFRASQHRIRNSRPELYVVRDGDRRGNPSGRMRRYTNPAPWLEQFAENQDRLRHLKEG